MMLFNEPYEELGSSDRNIVIKTAGKIKAQVGQSFVDLLKGEGNDVIQPTSGENDIMLGGNGFFCDGTNLYACYDGKKAVIATLS